MKLPHFCHSNWGQEMYLLMSMCIRVLIQGVPLLPPTLNLVFYRLKAAKRTLKHVLCGNLKHLFT